jgi:SAM-dependent methyltransferase
MEPFLQIESEKLTRSWTRHEPTMLRDYMVSGVEDPRINLQSIFSRHFLLYGLGLERFSTLMDHEYRFSAVMNWLLDNAGQVADATELENILHALKLRADNAEGLMIPRFVVQTFASLPTGVNDVTVPNYIETFLSECPTGKAEPRRLSLDTFCHLWNNILTPESSRFTFHVSRLHSALEPACGSANDYRFLERYGISRLLDYSGFDLCPANIENARALFPDVHFETGNVFEIPAADKSFDLCFTHDLLEHISLAGLEVAISEICRVTRRGICVGFFNMDEIPEHREQPVEEYHWNNLSMTRIRESFEKNGFLAQVRHVGTFLRQRVGCDQTHNPNAYTFILTPA